MQDIDVLALETVRGGGVVAATAGMLAAIGGQAVGAPAMPFLAFAGATLGTTYGAISGAQRGYARNGVPGAIVSGAADAVGYGLIGGGLGTVLPGLVAGTIVYDGVKRLTG